MYHIKYSKPKKVKPLSKAQPLSLETKKIYFLAKLIQDSVDMFTNQYKTKITDGQNFVLTAKRRGRGMSYSYELCTGEGGPWSGKLGVGSSGLFKFALERCMENSRQFND